MGLRKRLTFWGADQDDDSLPRAVMAGRKTTTSDLADSYYAGYGELGEGGYVEGDLIDVVDLRRRLRCRTRTRPAYRACRTGNSLLPSIRQA